MPCIFKWRSWNEKYGIYPGWAKKAKKELLDTVSVVQKELIRLSGFVEECLHFSKTGELNKAMLIFMKYSMKLFLLTPQAQLNGIQVELEFHFCTA